MQFWWPTQLKESAGRRARVRRTAGTLKYAKLCQYIMPNYAVTLCRHYADIMPLEHYYYAELCRIMLLLRLCRSMRLCRFIMLA